MAFVDVVKAMKAAKQETVVSNRLYNALRDGWMEARTRAYDDTDDGGKYPGLYFRASELHLMCPRMVALARKQPILQVHQIDTLWRFSLGKVYHTALQGALGSLPNDLFQGWWHQGEKVRKGENDGPCPKPAGKDWEYLEMEVFDRDLQFRGHMDGALHWPDRKEVLEIKSIDSHQIDRVNPAVGGSPLENHIVQVHVYMMLLGYDHARIVYVAKTSDSLDTVMFEHEVDRDPTRCEGIRRLLIECGQARMLKNTDALPKRLTACCKASMARAQQCPVQKRCFKAIG